MSRLMRLDRASGAGRRTAPSATSRALLRRGDLLVLNDTRVFPARLLGHREPGQGAVECLLVSRLEPSSATAGEERWQALVSPGARVAAGTRLVFDGPGGQLDGEVLGRAEHGRIVRLRTPDGSAVMAAIGRLGHMPLPPYIKRPDAESDRERYQTVYARHEGSVAAPTAGLHFTPEIFDALESAGIERTAITLHVGYGTFQPVRAELVADHRMAREAFEVGSRGGRGPDAGPRRGPPGHRRRDHDDPHARIARARRRRRACGRRAVRRRSSSRRGYQFRW